MKKTKLFSFARYYSLYFCTIFNTKNSLVRVMVVKICRKNQPETLLPKDINAKKTACQINISSTVGFSHTIGDESTETDISIKQH